MNPIKYPEVKLIADQRIWKAERRHNLVSEVRKPAQPRRGGGLFGLRRLVLQGA
jgi:hypothetical protein